MSRFRFIMFGIGVIAVVMCISYMAYPGIHMWGIAWYTDVAIGFGVFLGLVMIHNSISKSKW